MVAMSRALMMDPSVLLLDEPSAGLSPVRQDDAFIRVSDINKAGVTTIMVEQNARRCLQICDRGYVLDQGRDAYDGQRPRAAERPEGHRPVPRHARLRRRVAPHTDEERMPDAAASALLLCRIAAAPPTRSRRDSEGPRIAPGPSL